MDIKEIIRTVAVLSAVAGLLLTCGCMNPPGNSDATKEPSSYKGYNVVIIAFDGMQARHLYDYGYALNTTPNLDKFLDKSYLFTNAVSPASWTVPTFMSIFTSMYPSEHGLTNKFSGFDNATGQYIKANLKLMTPEAVTMAEIFKQNGYATGGFTGDAGISGSFGYGQGFDEYYDGTMFGGLDTSIPKAVDWVRKNKDRKFFLFLHGYDVHGQYSPTGGFDYRYLKTRYLGNYTGSPAEQGMLREKGLTGTLNLSDEDVRFWRAVYDEKINRADYQFKLFMDQMDEMGLMNDTVFVVLSDHGTEVYEHQKFDHGHTLYGELVDVLFSIHLPNQTQGTRVDSLVSTLDVMPTVLKLVGIENPVPVQTKGIDLTPSFTGTDVSRNIFSETDYRLYTHERMVQTPDGWKLIVTYPGMGRELYNLGSDPAEKTNLAGTQTAKADELGRLIDDHLSAMNATGPWTLGCVPVYNDQCKETVQASLKGDSSSAKTAEGKKLNILFITIDSLRADHMGVYGYDKNTTPFMDSFFENGIIFDNAMATGPYTFHTDSSVLTGLYPSQSGVYTWKTLVNKDKITLQKILKGKGYRTGAYVSLGLFMDDFMFENFDVYEKNRERRTLNKSTPQVTEFISRNDTPFFVFWHLYDVHLPYMYPPKEFYPKEYDGIFSNESINPRFDLQTKKTMQYQFFTDPVNLISDPGLYDHALTPEDIDYLKASYDYGVLATDRGLRYFFNSMNRSGLLNNTIIVITSDHGEDLKEHGYFFHSDIYENNAHVPLVISYPGNAPQRIAEPVSAVDIMPTLLGLLNETVPEGLEGRDLLMPHALDDPKPVFVERPPYDEYSIRTDKWKYILRNPDLKSRASLAFIKTTDNSEGLFTNIAMNDEHSGDELYDLSTDPDEQNNLIGRGYPVEDELRAQVTAFRDRMREAKNTNRIGEGIWNNMPIFTYP